MVQARVSEAEVSFHHHGEAVATYPRSHGQEPHIDYRHVIDSLVRKPGAFVRYLYREELFPRPVFRHAYDRLVALDPSRASAQLPVSAPLGRPVGRGPCCRCPGRAPAPG